MTIPPKTFQSTHSLRSATRTWPRLVKNVAVSIHALLAECDLFNNSGHLISGCFNPRTPCGVRRKKPFRQSSRQTVSIHALLAECDFSSTRGCAASTSFNPRTPCGVRLLPTGEIATLVKFQSTHSLRSATSQHVSYLRIIQCFNPRTPCGVRQWKKEAIRHLGLFQSTHSLRSATFKKMNNAISCDVSIHALLAECDPDCYRALFARNGFNPRTPCGVRRDSDCDYRAT